MDSQPVYIVRDTLAELSNDPRVVDFALSTFKGRGRLDLHLKDGCAPGLRTGQPDRPVVMLFDPQAAELLARDENGDLLTLSADVADPDRMAILVNAPLAWLGEASRSTARVRSDDAQVPADHPAGLNRAALGLLLRHVNVTDMVFGSDGRECSFQFQLADGYGGISKNAPEDWVGLDFDDATVELGWFDLEGCFRMKTFRRSKHGIEIAHLFADPLGHVLKDDREDGLSQSDTGMRALLEKLTLGLGASPHQG